MSEIRVNSIIAEGGSSAPNLTYGAQIPTGMGITGAGGINISGVVTCGSLAGNATGLTGNPSVSVTNLTVLGDQTVGGGMTSQVTSLWMEIPLRLTQVL